jgi:RNA polymerase sigma-70 factor (ECF subfamily)
MGYEDGGRAMVAIGMSTPEMVWVERARNGDTVAFETLLRRYERQIFAFTYRMMGGNAADADDLTQETFIKAYRALDRTADLLHVSAWLHRIAANSCRDEWRRRRRAGCQPWDATVHEAMLPSRPEENPESLMLQKEADERVQAVLNRMKPRNKQALILREYGGLSCEEIGAIMGVSHKAVKSTLFRARDEFRCQAAAMQ